MPNGRRLRRTDFTPREAEGLSSGQIYTTRAPGQRGSLLRREPGEERVLLRGGPGGVGAFRRTVPEEGFAPVEETAAFVKGAEAPVPEAAGPGESEAPAAEIGTPDWARSEMQKETKEYEAKIAERTKIVENVSSKGADLPTLNKILKSKGLDNLKEPKFEKYMLDLAQKTLSPTDLRGKVLQKKLAGETISADEEQFISGGFGADPSFDRAIGILRNDFDFQGASAEEKLQMLTDVQEQIRAGGGASAPAAPTTGEAGELDNATAQSILAEAGGDPDVARQIARQRGFRF